MQNSCHKDRNFGADHARDVMTDLSPIFIIIGFCLSLLALAILKFIYQQELMSPRLGQVGGFFAFLTAVVSQLLRLAFGLAGVRDLSRGNEIIGWCGILASFVLAVYEHNEAVRMAQHWGNPELSYIFYFWSGSHYLRRFG